MNIDLVSTGLGLLFYKPAYFRITAKVMASHGGKEKYLNDYMEQQISGSQKIYIPKGATSLKNQKEKFKRFEVGHNQGNQNEKFMILLGESGTGKTTLINAMFNYILGVKWKDDYSLKLIEEGPNSNSKPGRKPKPNLSQPTPSTINLFSRFHTP